MQEKAFVSKSGTPFFISAPAPNANRNTYFVIAAHKTGSVMLNGIVADICKVNNISDIAIEEQTWRQGIY